MNYSLRVKIILLNLVEQFLGLSIVNKNLICMKINLILFLLLFSLTAFSQRTITGTIVDSGGEPMIGANVIEQGTSNGTITDLDGAFSLTVSEGAMLDITYTGYADQLIATENVSNLNITLQEGALLDEVVVTALGIERKKRALAYSVTELEGSSLTTAKEINIGNSLAGKVAGVNVSNPATGPGGSTRIVIRGNGNISGNNQPLVVVDGVPINTGNLGAAGMWGGQDWGDGLSSLNADDVESVTVLKGNTAGALYGYRADNGVIVVTTKKGSKDGRIGVEFNSNYQVESIIDNYDFQRQYGHGDRGAKPGTEAEAYAQGLSSWGAPLDGSSVLQFDGVSRPYSDAGDNLGRFYGTGATFTNTLGLSGGGEKYGFRFSLTDLDNKGIVPNSTVDRKTFTANVNAKKGIFFGAISGSFVNDATANRPRLSDSPGNANYTAWSLPPSINIDDLRGDENKLGANADGTEFQFNDNAFVTNPWWAAYQFEGNNTKNRLFGNVSLGAEFIPGLTLTGKAGLDRFNERRRSLTPYGTAFSTLGELSESNRELQEVNLEVILRYVGDINSSVGIDLLVGGNQQRNFDETLSVGGNNFNIPFLHTARNLANQSIGYGYSQYQVNSVFAMAEISLLNSLYITATGRQDWFSVLTDPNGGASENSVFYPSVGVAYDLAEGLGDALPSIIDFAKFRASWAEVGGATTPYQLGLNYGIQGQGHLGQALGAINTNTVPPLDLKPSTNREFEIGMDLRMFKGKVNVDFAVYSRETIDGILQASISPTSGFGSKLVNVGRVTNKGIELLVDVEVIRNNNFTWRTSVNLAQNDNEVVSLLTDESDGEIIRLEESRTRNAYIELREGLPFSQVVGFAYARDSGGNIILDDANGFPQQGELQAFGTGVHPTSIGWQNSFSIGDVGISFLIDAKSGAKIYNATNAYGYFRGLHQATLEGRDSGIGTIPAADVQDYYQSVAFGISEEFIQDANFIKLRELIISYRLPNNLLEGIPFKDIALSFAGRNLALLASSTDNIDPESTYTTGNGQGLEMFGVPVTRSFGLNLSAKF